MWCPTLFIHAMQLQQLEITNTHRQQQYKQVLCTEYRIMHCFFQAQELIGVAEAEKEKLLSDRLSVSEVSY